MPHKINIPEDELYNYAARHTAGESLREISKSTKFSFKTLGNKFRENGIEIRPTYPTLTNCEIKNIVSRYQNGEGVSEIAAALGHGENFIKKYLLNADVKLRSRSEFTKLAHRRKEGKWRKHSIDTNAFSKVSEESAYWIGFLMADGCISGTKVFLTLQYRDLGHIEKLKLFLKSSHKIRFVNVKSPNSDKVFKQASFTFSSVRIVNDLKKFGIIPAKSLTAKVKGLEANRHFWRGVIDGDGTVGIMKRGNVPYISLIGSRDLVTQFLMFVKSIVNTNATIKDSNGNGRTFTLSLSNRKAFEVISMLYDDCSIYLSRKYESAQKIKTRYAGIDKNKSNLDELTIKIGEMYLQGLSGLKIKTAVGISSTAVYEHLKRYEKLTAKKVPRRHKTRQPHTSVRYREQGLCKDCGAETEQKRARCETHLQKARDYQRRKYLKNHHTEL